MLVVAALWIATLLLSGGFALDRVLTGSSARSFDAQLNYALTAMIAAAEIGPEGELLFTRALVDQRFDQPYSGLYYQVSGGAHEPFRSRSLWDRALKPDLGKTDVRIHAYTSLEFPSEPLRIVERDVTLPGSPVSWRFQVAESTLELEEQVAELRRTLTWSLSILGFGLFVLAVLQAAYGLWPLRRVSRAIAAIRSGNETRVPSDFPPEIAPLVVEINALLEHSERQAEEARTHAGNLAHALKTPMSVLTNEAAAKTPDLPEAVLRETATMRRHVDHHLARARAIGRRGASSARAAVWPSLEALQRAIERIHGEREVVIDIAGDKELAFAGERQDLEEMIGNLLDNGAKYGGGRVFVSVKRVGGMVEVTVEDDGPGIPAAAREQLFQRGARLDTGKPGTGLGLAIVRDVAEIYGGNVELGESEDLGGLSVTLRLPAAAASR
ncbi:sensor histidine kinase [Sphingoaurantiacus capsulatus]|uniref:histidine kinase n=1 Tax=Sphingoaurantiacus capsulatus TaxID=1771310 RepID=A0ABV7XFT4_9SPHN